MLGREIVLVLFVRDFEPPIFIFKNFTDRAAFYVEYGSDVFLPCIGVLHVVLANTLAVLVGQFVLVMSLALFGSDGARGLVRFERIGGSSWARRWGRGLGRF